MKRKILVPVIATLSAVLLLSGCGKKTKTEKQDKKEFTLTTQYIVDGEVSNTAPDGQFYDFVKIENDKNATVEWNIKDWKPETSELKEDTTCTVYFTKTTAVFKMNNTGYLTLQSAFNDVEPGIPAVVDCHSDFSGYAVSAAGTEITLNLNGHTIDGVGNNTISNQGLMYIFGEGTITNSLSSESSISIVNYGELTLTDVELNNATSSITVWNSDNGISVMNLYNCDATHQVTASNVINNSGVLNIYSGIYYATSDEGFCVIKINGPAAELNYYDGTIDNNGEGFSIGLVDGSFHNLSAHDIEKGYNLGEEATHTTPDAE